MKKQAGFVLAFYLVCGLTSCNMPIPSNPSLSREEVVQQYRTVETILTETAQPRHSSTHTVSVQVTHTLAATETPEPAALITAVNSPAMTKVSGVGVGGQAANVPCDLAKSGLPIDVTVPDETRFYPGEVFSKTWRLYNTGSCSWTKDYAVIWFSGDDMGVHRVEELSAEVVHPGHLVDVTVDMVAPQTPGTYQSNWKVRSPQGDMFGIGPNGDAPFWVRIVVVPLNTPTPTVTPTEPTPTHVPEVLASGSLDLLLDDRADLDSGLLAQGAEDDLAFQNPEEGIYVLASLNGATLSIFGTGVPRLEDCLAANGSEDPLSLEPLAPGQYLCYRTSRGSPGWAALTAADTQTGQFGIQFLTWREP